jgi:1,4-dihydroxy-2-naphthoyl-CoA hydrolase
MKGEVTPMQPEEEQIIRALETDNQHLLAGTLGMQILKGSADEMIVRMPISDSVRQPYGLLHGGATVALAETAASIGTWLGIDRDHFLAVGLEINANHLRAVRAGAVTATATPIHRGRTTWVWDIRITDESGRLTAISRCTVAVVPRPA